MKHGPSWGLIVLLMALAGPADATFSIIAVDPSTGQVGSAGATCIPDARWISVILPGTGGSHTQAFGIEQNRQDAHDLMVAGYSPQEIVNWLVAHSVGDPALRQYGVVDLVGGGRSAAHTGVSCWDWKGHRLGATYAIQGNILLGPQILDDMESAFLNTTGTLADRLMAALQAANVPGADARCLEDGKPALSAFLRVADASDPVDNLHMDLDVPDTAPGQNPIGMLQGMYDAWLAGPTARFSATPAAGPVRLVVTFADLSNGDINSRVWNFGDGGTSTAQNPSHTYTVAGVYDVSLTVSNGITSDTRTINACINVGHIADFSATPTSGSIPLTVAFEDLTAGDISSWNWTFGDGGTSTSRNPSHTYTIAGSYDVSLTVANDSFSDAKTVAGCIAVGQFEALADIPLGNSGPARGVSLADYDGDHDLDVLVTSYNAPSRLLRNDGDMMFVDATVGPLAIAAPAVAAVWADFDNDGDLDIFQTLDGQANRLLRNNGVGGFADVADASMVADPGAGRAAGWADYNGDGKVDLCVVNGGQDNILYRSYGDPGTGSWLFLGSPFGGGNTGNDNCMSWADFDNDGDQDYYLTYRYGANRLMQNGGAYGFLNRATSVPLADTGNGMGCAWGDYDNDGWLDLYVANGSSRDLLVHNDGGSFWLVSGGPLGDIGQTRGVAWGDADNDGDLDLYVTRYGQFDLLLRNDGGDVFTSIPTAVAPTNGNGVGCAWGDLDGDGDLDLYLANDGGPSALLRNKIVNSNHWLEIDLVGVASNRSAIGARVRAVTGERRQLREVSGGSGYYSQNALTVHFGLGESAEVDSLQVIWPNGDVRVLCNLPADRHVTIWQDQTNGVAMPEPLPKVFALEQCRPNPFNPVTTIRFDLPRDSRVSLRVYDLAGRMVQTLVADELLTAGQQEVVWRGCDEAGRQMGSGVYFYRMEAGSFSDTRRMTLVK